MIILRHTGVKKCKELNKQKEKIIIIIIIIIYVRKAKTIERKRT
jgi:hypothetical protein